MRPPHFRSFALAALAALLAGNFAAPVLAKWSHPAVPRSLPASSSSATSTTATVQNAINTNVPVKPPVSWNLTNPSPKLAKVTTTTVEPAITKTVTTTVVQNADGSATTTTSTTISGSTTTVTTTLTNPPANNPPGVTVTSTTSPPVNGVTTTTLKVVTLNFRRPPTTIFETSEVQTVTVTPPITTVTSTTTPIAPSVTPPGVTPSLTPPGLLGGGNPPGDIEAAVKAASDEAQAAILVCPIDTPPCIADALDAYAAALQKLAPYLPPQLRTLPGIVARAATKVRAAKTKAEAVQAVKTAIAEVHKTISLLKADDSATRQVGTREGTLVAQTLQVASDKLEKAVGL
jgi:hypothetical protein